MRYSYQRLDAMGHHIHILQTNTHITHKLKNTFYRLAHIEDRSGINETNETSTFLFLSLRKSSI